MSYLTKFSVAAVVEDLVWTLRLADYDRSLNRRNINDLFNGKPPFSPEDQQRNNLNVNNNFLQATQLAHDARGQFNNAFTKPSRYFGVNLDRGPKIKRKPWSSTITNLIKTPMKKSLAYYETMRSGFANAVLHGIGPCVWDDRDKWRPEPKGVEDIMIPGGTLLTMDNLPFFAVYQPYTANQLRRLTTGPKVDPAWNLELVEKLIKYAEDQLLDFGIPYSEIYSPEKMAERLKGDAGFVSGDSTPTIDCWDFYFWNDDKKVSGWNRRMILDANWGLGYGGYMLSDGTPDYGKAKGLRTKVDTRDQFLYNPGDRKYANKLSELIHWDFADLSAVGPFRYHSIRSLGFLLFGPCHISNRMLCSFFESVFEQLCQYFRVNSLDEVQRALKVNLVNRGFIDETIKFVGADERWQVNTPLAQIGLNMIQQIIGRNSTSFTQAFDYGREQSQKTATQFMGEAQFATALVSAALTQAYEYKKFEYYEIARRFCRKNSKDPDVRKFRLECLKAGIDENVLDVDCWEIEPEKVMGAGNKMLEVAIAEKLMAIRPMLDPEPQREVVRDYILATSDDSARAERWVPYEPVKITDAVHDAQLAAGTLMQGLRVDIKTGMNHIEYVEALIGQMGMVLNKIEGRGGMATIDELVGLQNMAGHIMAHVEIIGQDQTQKERVREYQEALSQMGNLVKGYEQRLNEQMAAQQQGGNGGLDPKDAAKINAIMLQAKVKAENMQTSHAARTAQKRTQWELQMQQEQERHQLEMNKKLAELQTNQEATDMELGHKLARNRLSSLTE